MFGGKGKRESAAAKVERLEGEAKSLRASLAAVTRDNEVLRGQLVFWHEHSRGLENKVQMLMREQLSILEAFRAGLPGEAEYLDLIRRSREAFDAAEGDRVGIASLIAAISLAGSRQSEVIGELIPSLKPTLDRLAGEVQKRPPTRVLGVKEAPRLR